MSSWVLPAMEFNMGAAPNLQLHVVIPGSYVTPQGSYGIGDIELGAKYRFIQETATCPQVGVFPMLGGRRAAAGLESATGRSGRACRFGFRRAMAQGGYYNVRENLSLLFMLGRTVSGERHTVRYPVLLRYVATTLSGGSADHSRRSRQST